MDNLYFLYDLSVVKFLNGITGSEEDIHEEMTQALQRFFWYFSVIYKSHVVLGCELSKNDKSGKYEMKIVLDRGGKVPFTAEWVAPLGKVAKRYFDFSEPLFILYDESNKDISPEEVCQ